MTDTTQAPAPTERPAFIRHVKFGYFKLKRDCWGERYEKSRDPEGKDAEIPQDLILPADFAKLPKDQWARIVHLYFELCDPHNRVVDSRSEVSVIFVRKAPDYREWRTLVPKQTVGASRVDADLTKLCDLVTGEETSLAQLGIEGWDHAGSSHSHNTMKAFFSGTDDEHELPVQGMHVVVGELDIQPRNGLRYYVPKASIVINRTRHIVPSARVLDIEGGIPYLEPHAKVKEFITKYTYTSSGFSSDYDRYRYLWCSKHDKVFHSCSCSLKEFKERLEAAGETPETAKREPEKTEKKGDDDTEQLTIAAIRRRARAMIEESSPKTESEPKFQKEIDNETRDAAFKGDQQAIRIRLAVTEARRQARSLPDKQGRTVHRLCDALQSCRLDKTARDVLWQLMLECCDDSDEDGAKPKLTMEPSKSEGVTTTKACFFCGSTDLPCGRCAHQQELWGFGGE